MHLKSVSPVANRRSGVDDELDADASDERQPETDADDVADIEADIEALERRREADRAALPAWMRPYHETQTREAGLLVEPDEEVFGVCWTLPEVVVTVLGRRGEDWRPRLLAAVHAELSQLCDEYVDPDLVDGDGIRFATIDPVVHEIG